MYYDKKHSDPKVMSTLTCLGFKKKSLSCLWVLSSKNVPTMSLGTLPWYTCSFEKQPPGQQKRGQDETSLAGAIQS